jgi:hypothetical protein
VQSPDGGQTWEDRRPGGPFDTHTIALHPQAPDRLFIAAGDGYYESADGGATWQRPAEGLPYHYLWSIAVDPATADTVLVSASPSPWHAHHLNRGAPAQAGIYRRTHGERWRPATRGLPGEEGTVVPLLGSHRAEPGVVYALSNQGVYRSADMGLSWEQLALPWLAAYRTQHQQALAIAAA